jgi:GT2 family glycosyltransferase
MDTSIIIVNYNTKDFLLSAIHSIYSSITQCSFEIIVVDNASVDGSQEALKNNFPEVILIELTQNIGFGRANNLGVKSASGDFLFFLNSDIILLNNVLSYFVNYFNNNKEKKIGCIGSYLLDSDLKISHSFGVFPTPKYILIDTFLRMLKLNNILSDKKFRMQKQPVLNVDYVTGADMFMEKSLFIEHEGFDEDFFMYFEESDLQFRLFKNGYSNIIIDGPRIIHLEGKSYSANQLRRMNYTKSLFIFIRKHYKKSFMLFKYFYLLLRLPGLLNLNYTFKERMIFLKYIVNLN